MVIINSVISLAYFFIFSFFIICSSLHSCFGKRSPFNSSPTLTPRTADKDIRIDTSDIPLPL
ncbi:MAG: hypothetical protein ACI4V4_04325 [Eubacterium sp.]